METNKAKNLILILLFILLVVNISIMLTLFFQRKHHERQMNCKENSCMNDNEKYMLDELKLTEAQKIPFFKLRDEHRANMNPFFDSIKVLKNTLLETILDNSLTEPDKNQIQIAEQISKIEYEVQLTTIKYFLSIKNILDERQFKVFVERFKKVCGCKHSGKDRNYHIKDCQNNKSN